jgi:hypothetical protein
VSATGFWKKRGVKSENYCPSRLGSFDDFAKRWMTDVVATMSPSTQSGFKSDLKAWKEALRFERNGEIVSMPMRELEGGRIQSVITQWHTGNRLKKVGAKTIKNRVGVLRNAWKCALEWSFTRT